MIRILAASAQALKLDGRALQLKSDEKGEGQRKGRS